MNIRFLSAFIALVVLPIALGTAVYVGWRSTNLLIFDWMAIIGIPDNVFRPSVNLSQSMLYSFPDGCWVFAGTSWMLFIWRRISPWVFAVAILGIGSELGQGIGLVPGTFEWNDIVFYVGGFILSCIGYKYAKTHFIDNRSFGHGGDCFWYVEKENQRY